ncbi:probable CCR4-associated factor 1 homolog 2 [Prosopis cineraria]|uniref:probable CCR4-associated factor 1 homolog 2 n=1 Tax=Prosopis cineraria TaxID=364024 RepID=UPI002410A289|nr:probable CCR4-associated factor 1 homolog 2 [Prosopis cineraria]
MASVEGSDSVQIVDVWRDNMEQEFSLIQRSYGALSGNLGLAKLIQVGLTLSDEQGNIPMIMSSTTHEAKQRVWQFNFCEFDPKNRSQISRHHRDSNLQWVLMSSRLVQDDKVQWIAFGSSDFGYMVKLLTGKKNLPETEQEFFKILKDFSLFLMI